tara:strand:- start:128 stop:2353 length:2226 start_codon:yes stop_codon:yes gene_type:complete
VLKRLLFETRMKKEASLSSSDHGAPDLLSAQDLESSLWANIFTSSPEDSLSESKNDKFDEIKAGEAQAERGARDRDDDLTVEKIQRKLEDHGYGLRDHGVDGRFGPETEDAIVNFQRTNDLAPTGIVDSDTLKLLDSSFAKKFTSAAPTGAFFDKDLYEDIVPGDDINRMGSDAALDAFAKAIARRESGGNYKAENNESKAYGKYQIMPKNWPRWARQAGLSSSTSQTPENQEIVAKHKFRKYFDELGEWWLVAVKWYSGGGGVNKMKRLRETDPSLASARKNISYKGGKRRYSGIASYADKVMKEYYSNMGQTYEGVRVYASLNQTLNKLYNLKQYLLKNGFRKEASYLNIFLKKSSEEGSDNFTMPLAAGHTMPIDLEETPRIEVPRIGSLPPVQVSSSEEALNRNGIEIIKYIAGTEAERRGEGVRTVEGNIYEVIYRGERAIAKVVPSTNSEPDVWRQISGIEFTEEQKKYLPKIHKIIDDIFDTIIIMEVLEPFSGHMESILRTRRGRGSEDLLKNEDFVHDAVFRSFDNTIEALKDKAEGPEEESVYRAFVSEYESIRRELEKLMLIKEIDLDTISEFVANKLSNISNLFMLNDNSFISKIADKVQNNIKSYFQTSERPIPKYYSARGVDETIGLLQERLQNNAQGYSAGRNRRQMEALIKEREKAVYTESPESFLYSENYMPETEGLFSLLKILKEHGINWSDVHAKNLMQRPGSREPVIIDVGLYEMPGSASL